MSGRQKKTLVVLLMVVLMLLVFYFFSDSFRALLSLKPNSEDQKNVSPVLSADEIQKALKDRYTQNASDSKRIAEQEKKASDIQEALTKKPSPTTKNTGEIWSYENYPGKTSSSLTAAEIQKSLESKNN